MFAMLADSSNLDSVVSPNEGETEIDAEPIANNGQGQERTTGEASLELDLVSNSSDVESRESYDDQSPKEQKDNTESRHLSNHDLDHDHDGVHGSLPHPDELERVKVKRSSKVLQTIAGVAGNILEWYDFAIFGFLGDVIGENFFPPQEGHANLIESFTVFGSAFLMRPIGGILMGHIGDIYGRKRALEISIFLMAFPTFAMGCLPTYDHVGYFATVCLILTRLIQGLSVGGQLVSSLVYTVENNPKEKWGLYGSYVMAAANFGTLLGSIFAFSLKASLTHDELRNWGWRIPFLSGLFLCLSGVYLRFYCEDDVMEHGGQTTDIPLKSAFKLENLRSLFAASMVPMLWAGGVYTSFVWMSVFMEEFVKVSSNQAFGVNSIALFVSICILFPAAGMFSDFYGRTRVMYIGGTSLFFLSPIMVIVISRGNAIASFFAQSTLGICLSLWGAPMCAWLVESFPSHVRLTSVAVGYNLAQAIAGGSSPAVATYIADTYGNHAPGFMISTLALISLVGLLIAPKAEMTASSVQAHSVLKDFSLDENNEEGNTMFQYDNETEML